MYQRKIGGFGPAGKANLINLYRTRGTQYEAFAFTTESIFLYGMYEGNTLIQVYKLNPGYIDWSIYKLKNFVVDPDFFEQQYKVFDHEQLMMKGYDRYQGESVITDLSSLQVDFTKDFQIPGVREIDSGLSKETIQKNLEKCYLTNDEFKAAKGIMENNVIEPNYQPKHKFHSIKPKIRL